MATSDTDVILDTQNESQTLTKSISPSPDATESPDQKLSRKREREVSLEPSTPRPDIEDHATTPSGTSSGLRSPKKRNRVQLDTTEEEDVASKSRTPSRSRSGSRSSPPHEVKVRQISRGVEDLTWRRQEKAILIAGDTDANALSLDPTESATPVVATSPTPSTVEIDADEASPDRSMEKLQEFTHTRHSSGSEGDDLDKGLKRKLADRATSHGPENGASKTLDQPEASKRPRDEDDNPRAKKRPTPPRSPEAVGEKSTPPTTPPSDNGELPKAGEALKRPRDEDNDDNPRQTKKPSPPPEKTQDKKTVDSTPKLGGFMAYASTGSPFASVKGQNLFGGSSKPASLSQECKPSTSPSTANFPLSSVFATPSSALGDTTSSFPTATKRTGFEAFSASTSLFASAARAKSPTALGSNALRPRSPSHPRVSATKPTSAFASYASGGAQAFAIPVPKRARAGSPDGSSSRSSLERNSAFSVFGTQDNEDEDNSRRDDGQLSFGEKLRAGKDAEEEASDEDVKPELTAQAVLTGEEEEKSMYMVRAKLFCLSDQNQWKERGTGTLKLNVRKSDGERARLVMRKEAVFTVLLNVTLFHGMSVFIAQDPRYIRLSVIEDGATVHYNLRVASAKIGKELLDAIEAYIPTAPI